MLFALDLLFINGQGLRRLPLIERRDKLRQIIPVHAQSANQFSDHYEGEGTELFKQACAMGLEGIVSKRALSPYKSGPSKLQARIEKLSVTKAAIKLPKVRKPQWLRPELRVKVAPSRRGYLAAYHCFRVKPWAGQWFHQASH